MSSAFGGLCALALAPAMGKRFDKKKSVIISTVALGCFFSSPYLLRFANLFPEKQLAFAIANLFHNPVGAYTSLWIAISISNSMMAEVVDEFESHHQKRNEGFFFYHVFCL